AREEHEGAGRIQEPTHRRDHRPNDRGRAWIRHDRRRDAHCRYQASSCVPSPRRSRTTMALEVLAHPNFSDSGSDCPCPFIFLFARDRVSEGLPPGKGLPRYSGRIAARAERDSPLASPSCPLLDESHEAGADAPALEMPGHVDVDELELGSPVLRRHEAHDLVI